MAENKWERKCLHSLLFIPLPCRAHFIKLQNVNLCNWKLAKRNYLCKKNYANAHNTYVYILEDLRISTLIESPLSKESMK